MINSSMIARAGRRRHSKTHSATSAAVSIFARASESGGEGRFSNSGVSISPGKTAHARMPWDRSSELMLGQASVPNLSSHKLTGLGLACCLRRDDVNDVPLPRDFIPVGKPAP